MMTRKAISTVIFGGALALGSSNVMAMKFGVDYTTELQTDFNGGYDWLNLLKLSANVPVWKSLALEASTISVAKTGDEPLIDDMLTYSNIEAGNIPLTFARLGFGFSIKDAEMFVGINNVNEDYFTSELTSFFTNSPCGISPTISCNFDIANYPVAAWCIHYSQRIGPVGLNASLYPGKGYSRLLGHDNLFSLNIKRDGIFSITSIDYTNNNGIYCVLGTALHYGVCIADEEGEQEAASSPSRREKRFAASPWILSEFSFPHDIGLHAHASYSTVENGCKWFAGVGLLYLGKKFQPGVAFNYAWFSEASEYSAEIACRIPLFDDKAYLQPSIHFVTTDARSPRCVGMLRFNVSI